MAGAAVLDAVPAVKSRKQTRIPSVWDPADVTKILDAVDRGNPCGKRDYAIILLITRLGLRGIDVRRLEFCDFDWPGNRLSVVQAKTGRRVWLPLLKDVGWAVIDYIRCGRPVSDFRQVFIRHTAPIGPFSDQDHLHQILVKHARAAHVRVSEKRRHGMHSLRHTLATRLMEDGTPAEQIAGILGHQSVQSTGVYLKSSLGLLAKCALDRTGPRRRRHDDPASRWPTRSQRSSRRNAPSATSTPPRRRCWPGSKRSAAASSPDWARSPRSRSRRGSRPPGGGESGRRHCKAWPRRSGSWPAGRAATAPRPTSCPPACWPSPPATSRTSTPTRNWRPCSPRLTGATTVPGPIPAPGHAGAVPDDLRLRSAFGRSPSAASGRCRHRRRSAAGPRRQGRQRPAGARLRAAACQARRLPRPARRAFRLGLVLPRQGPAADAREHRQELPPVPLAGPHLPRRAGPRSPRS